jgi:hypothetical protein
MDFFDISKKPKSKDRGPTNRSPRSNSPSLPRDLFSNLPVKSNLPVRSSSEFRSRASSNLRTPRSHTSSGPRPRSKSRSRSRSRSNSPLQKDLKMPGVLSRKLNYSEKIAKKMKKTFQSHDKVVPFTASFHLSNLFFLYLFKKYKMNCIIPGWRYGIDLHLDLKNTDPIINDFQDDLIEQITEKILNCILDGSKIIIIPFIFEIIIDDQPMGSHANLLIYRRNTGQIEHFEPHGAVYEGVGGEFVTEQIHAFLKRFVKNLNSLIKEKEENKLEGLLGKREKIQKIKLINSYDVCPEIEGLQALEETSDMPRLIIEPDGYCSAWSMFFTELCLKNPERSSRDIYDAIMERTELYDDKNAYLRNVIRGYTYFINNKIAKHFSHVFDEDGFIQNIDSIVEQLDFNNPDPIEGDKLMSYRDKLLEIIEVETGQRSDKTKAYPEARSRYNEFTRGIREETSSSSYKSDHHISPPRKTQKSSFQSRSPPHSNADKGVGLKKRKTKGMKKGKKRKTMKHH